MSRPNIQLQKGVGRGADDPTLENTLVTKYEEAIAGWKLVEASEEGQGSRRAVEPMMMMMMVNIQLLKNFPVITGNQLLAIVRTVLLACLPFTWDGGWVSKWTECYFHWFDFFVKIIKTKNIFFWSSRREEDEHGCFLGCYISEDSCLQHFL
jgi:hypothetical protein